MHKNRSSQATVLRALGAAALALGLAAGARDAGAQPLPNLFTCQGLKPTVLAVAGTSTITGTSGPDVIVSLGGNRTIQGLGGDDVICGSADQDTIYGGSGNDRLYGFGGNDRLYGESGNDWLYGGSGIDRLWGGDGNDRLYGEGDADELYGQDGSDLLDGGDGDDYLSGDMMSSWGQVGVGDDQLFGGPGNDIMHAGPGHDALYGGDGNDQLWGGAGYDEMFGGFGDDIMHGDGGDDRLWGGFGSDWLYGDDGNDELHGESGNDVLVGGPGADTLLGDDGDDVLHATIDVDVAAIGGTGTDTCYRNFVPQTMNSCEYVAVDYPEPPVTVELTFDQITFGQIDDGVSGDHMEVYASLVGHSPSSSDGVRNIGLWGYGDPCPEPTLWSDHRGGVYDSCAKVVGPSTYSFSNVEMCKSPSYLSCPDEIWRADNNTFRFEVRPGETIRASIHMKDYDDASADDDVCKVEKVIGPFTSSQLNSLDQAHSMSQSFNGDASCTVTWCVRRAQ